MTAVLRGRPWMWSFLGAGLVWLAAIAYTGGQGGGGMLTAALSLAVFTVVVGVGQMFVITLGPGNVDLSLPANIGLASAVAMTVDGRQRRAGRRSGCWPRSARGLAVGQRQLSADPRAADSAHHRHAVGQLHHPVDRYQLWPRPADQAAGRVRRFHQPADRRRAAAGAADACCSRPAPRSCCIAPSLAARCWRSARTSAPRASPASASSRCGSPPMRCAAALGGLDGALLAGYFRGANVDIGNEYLLASIAVVVIGGTSVAGGRANVAGRLGRRRCSSCCC